MRGSPFYPPHYSHFFGNTVCILLFDIGNTNLKVAVSRGLAAPATYALPSSEKQTADAIGLLLLDILRHQHLQPEEISACIGASVVPGLADLTAQAVQKYLGKRMLFAPEDVPIPLENKYARPHEVGADRLVGAFAARRLYPQAPSIICVDFGTATTFDCVSGNTYLGGLICPGVLSSMNALAANTAKLPRISLEVETTTPEPGRSTATSLNHGFVFGFAAMAEGLCEKLSAGLPGPVCIVGTGGFSSALARVTTCFTSVHPDLLLEGLRLLYTETYGSAPCPEDAG